MTKKVLIVALAEHWPGISRLPAGLKRAGFDVAAMCPKTSFLSKTRFLDEKMLYSTFTYTRSKVIYFLILRALSKFKPDLIVPGDEEALLAMQKLANLLEGVPVLKKYSAEIRRSIIAKEFDPVVLNKSQFVDRCRQWGINVPRNLRVENLEMALQKAPEFGYPLVLKFDFGYGASGVSICQNDAELKKAFAKHRKTSLPDRLKSFVKHLLFVAQKSDENSISLQQYIVGTVGQVPFVAKDGQVFAMNPMLKYKTYPGATGPTSVSKGLDNDEVRQAAVTAAKNLRFTGIASLDFIIEDSTQKAYVIEMNPRPIPTGHFSAELCAVDLCVSLYRGFNGLPIEENAFKPFLVALFPNEKRRDPQSPYLTEGYHDIPQNDPALLAALEAT